MNVDIRFDTMKNLQAYNTEMAKSWYDKLGFIDKIFEEINVIVDFGCADGSVTKFIRQFYPEAYIIGYDLTDVLKANRILNVTDPVNKIYFTDDWEYIKLYMNQGKSLLIMNSVLHEIYNYMDIDDITELFFKISNTRFDYIWMRDMFVKDNLGIMNEFRTEQLNNTLAKINNNEKLYNKKLDFEKIYGEITDLVNLTHFLMKCRYDLNWDREVLENYLVLSTNYNQFNKIFGDKYKTVYQEHYLLEYNRFINQKEFKIDLRSCEISTHIREVRKLKN